MRINAWWLLPFGAGCLGLGWLLTPDPTRQDIEISFSWVTEKGPLGKLAPPEEQGCGEYFTEKNGLVRFWVVTEADDDAAVAVEVTLPKQNIHVINGSATSPPYAEVMLDTRLGTFAGISISLEELAKAPCLVDGERS